MVKFFALAFVLLFSSGALADSKFCSVADRAAKAAGGFIMGSTGGSAAARSAGLSVVEHSSGALITTSSGRYVAGTLGTIGSIALGVVTSPVFVAGAVSAVAVSAATIGYCSVSEPPKISQSARSAPRSKRNP